MTVLHDVKPDINKFCNATKYRIDTFDQVWEYECFQGDKEMASMYILIDAEYYLYQFLYYL